MFSGAQFLGCKTGGWQRSAKIALVCLYRVSGSSSPLLFFATNQYFHGGNMRVSELISCQEYFHVRNIFMLGMFSYRKYESVRNISMSGIFSCQEYFHGGNMSLLGTIFLEHSYPSRAPQCFAS